MPRGDGKGPAGQGQRGRGRGQVGGRGLQGGFAAGPGGDCICPNCNNKVPHQQGMPCKSLKCPKCGKLMTRAL